MIPSSVLEKVLKKLHMNHIVIEKTGILACKSIYCINMSVDIGNTVKIALHVSVSRQHRPRTKQYHTKCHRNLSEHNPFIVDYHSRSPVIKQKTP